MSTDITTIFASSKIESKPSKYIYFIALELENGEYMTIQPVSAKYVTNWITIEGKNKIDVVCGTLGTGVVEREKTPMFAYGSGDDLYGLMSDMWGDILKNDHVNGRTTWRSNKEYAELYKYLGWCSWEQYKLNINEPLLLDAVEKIENSPLPIR